MCEHALPYSCNEHISPCLLSQLQSRVEVDQLTAFVSVSTFPDTKNALGQDVIGKTMIALTQTSTKYISITPDSCKLLAPALCKS